MSNRIFLKLKGLSWIQKLVRGFNGAVRILGWEGQYPWRAIRPHLLDTVDKARNLWPDALKDLPMDDE